MLIQLCLSSELPRSRFPVFARAGGGKPPTAWRPSRPNPPTPGLKAGNKEVREIPEPNRLRKKAENRLLTRAAQNRAHVFAATYRAATVRGRSQGAVPTIPFSAAC